MILVSPPYRTNWGCLLARLRHDPPGVYSTSWGRPSMFVLRRCVSTPEIFGGRFGKIIVEPDGKAIDNTQGRSQSSKLLRGTVRRTTALSPAAGTGLRSSPRSKRMTRPCGLAYSALELFRGAMPAHAGWGTLDARAERRGPAQAFSSSQLCTLCWPALLRRH